MRSLSTLGAQARATLAEHEPELSRLLREKELAEAEEAHAREVRRTHDARARARPDARARA
eukprot:2170177-Pleurochrysis_carterae.AAC.1